MSMTLSPLGELLRQWRGARGMSQLDLALAAGVSSRHVSFVETGRSQPSRPMTLRLAETLDLSLRERNELLLAAGFAPMFQERGVDDAALEPVRRALELVLETHEPYPAFVLDRAGNVLLSNGGFRKLLRLMLPAGSSAGSPVNVVRLCLDPDLLRSRLRNWEVVAHVLGHRVSRQLRSESDPRVRELFEELLAFPAVREAMEQIDAPAEYEVVIPMEFEMDGTRLSWFSTIATIGTPRDITLEDLRIESLFPADEGTEQTVRALLDAARR